MRVCCNGGMCNAGVLQGGSSNLPTAPIISNGGIEMTFEQLVKSFPQWSKEFTIKDSICIECGLIKYRISNKCPLCGNILIKNKPMTFYTYVARYYRHIKNSFESCDKYYYYLIGLKKSTFKNTDESTLEGLLRAAMAYFDYVNSLN